VVEQYVVGDVLLCRRGFGLGIEGRQVAGVECAGGGQHAQARDDAGQIAVDAGACRAGDCHGIAQRVVFTLLVS